MYFYFSGGSDALAAIGLIAFVGVAQFLPSLIGGIFWRSATRSGAIVGLIIGFGLWAYTLFLPSFGGQFLLNADVLAYGPFGIELLRPQALFGMNNLDPLVHAVVWSVGVNVLSFVVVSSLTTPDVLERLQATLFVDVYKSTSGSTSNISAEIADSEDLFILA